MSVSRFRIATLNAILSLSLVAVASAGPGATVEQAETLLQSENWSAAADAFTDLTRVEPENGRAWMGLATALHRSEDFKGAIGAYERAAELGYQAPIALYHAARAAAASGDKAEALELLERMVDAGGKPYGAVTQAPEFEPLRSNKDFQTLVARMKPCNSPEYRQFDFWVGSWEVSAPNGQVVGRNEISPIEGDCALREVYSTTARGYSGTSLSFYDATSGHWYQTWVDNRGGSLLLRGELDDGSMVLGTSDGTQRITWSRLSDGRVRQLWESSQNGGETWTVAFDGYYSKTK